MTTAYERNRAAYYRWIEDNPDKYKENNKRQQEKKRLTKQWQTISAKFRNILIDELT